MKNNLVLSLLGLVVVVGAGIWWLGSKQAPEGKPAPAPAAPALAANAPKGDAHLEAQPGEKRGEVAQPKPAQGDAAGKATKTEALPLSPAIAAGGLDGGAPSDISAVPDFDQFQVKWNDAKLPELKAAFESYEKLYQSQVDGSVTDKSQLMSQEDLQTLAREVAWLKEKAYGG